MIPIFKHGWILFIVVTFVNAFIFKTRSKKFVDKNPELKPGYGRMFRAYLIYGNIPWIIMGIGILSATTNSMFDYFRPASMNPIVLAFHFSIVLILILFAHWVYFRKGADFLASHPGFLQVRGFGDMSEPSPQVIRIIVGIMFLAGVAALTVMWIGNFPPFPEK